MKKQLLTMDEVQGRLAEFGLKRDRVTIWRWRKRGLIPTINVRGRSYVTQETMESFLAKVVQEGVPV